MKLWVAAGPLCGVLLLPLVRGEGQSVPMQQDSPVQMPGADQRDGSRDLDPYRRQRDEKQGIARNTQRHEQLVRDTDKLLALATSLKAEVDKSNKDTLSVSVVKRAEEIEKLAKSVKEKMRQ